MQPWMRSTMVLLIILLLVTVAFAILYKPAEPVNIPEAPKAYIELEMSLTGISPDEIVVMQWTVVTLNITSLDVKHTFGLLVPYGINVPVPAGETVHNRRFEATVYGTFTYECLEISPEHWAEQGTLRVTPNSSRQPSMVTLPERVLVGTSEQATVNTDS